MAKKRPKSNWDQVKEMTVQEILTLLAEETVNALPARFFEEETYVVPMFISSTLDMLIGACERAKPGDAEQEVFFRGVQELAELYKSSLEQRIARSQKGKAPAD